MPEQELRVILDRFRLDDRVAIVTGSGRGIGAATAVALGEAGANVVVSSRTKEELDEVAGRIRDAGGEAAVVPADLSDTSAITDLVDAALDAFGGVDVVVNNLGGTIPMPFLDTSEDYLEEAFHFNVTTAFALSKGATPALLEGDGGAIVNVSSVMGRLRERGYLAYGTAKAALAHMTRLMAADLAPRIRVNAVAVGSVETSALAFVASDEDLRRGMEEKTPLRRLGAPEDVAAGILWLTSDAGSWVTGKVIEIDGGLEYPNFSFDLPDLSPGTEDPTKDAS